MQGALAYESNQAKEVDIKVFLPLVNISGSNLANLAQDAVVQHHPIEPAEGVDGGINRLLSERKVSQVAVNHLHLLPVLLLQLLEWLDTASHNDNIVCLGCCEEVLGNGKTDACEVVSPSREAIVMEVSPREAPVTMIVLAVILNAVSLVSNESSKFTTLRVNGIRR